MSSEDENELFNESRLEVEEQSAIEAGVNTEETTRIIRNPEKHSKRIEYLENHPKVRNILKNPNVSEVHIKWKIINKKQRQPYVCIIFHDHSSVERPLIDIQNDEEPLCPINPNLEEHEHHRHHEDGHHHEHEKTMPVPQEKKSWWKLGGKRDKPDRRSNNDSDMIDNPIVYVKKTGNKVRRLCSQTIYRSEDSIVVREKSITKFFLDDEEEEEECSKCGREKHVHMRRNNTDDSWHSH